MYPCEYTPYDPAPGHDPAWRVEDATAPNVFQIGPTRFVEVNAREGTATTAQAASAYMAKHAPADWWDARRRGIDALGQQMWFVAFCREHGASPEEGVYVAHHWQELPLLITRRPSIYGYWSLVVIDTITCECVWSLPLDAREDHLEGIGFDIPAREAEVIEPHPTPAPIQPNAPAAA